MSDDISLSIRDLCPSCNRIVGVFGLSPTGGIRRLFTTTGTSNWSCRKCRQPFICDHSCFARRLISISLWSMLTFVLFFSVLFFLEFWSDTLFVIFLLTYGYFVYRAVGAVQCFRPYSDNLELEDET